MVRPGVRATDAKKIVSTYLSTHFNKFSNLYLFVCGFETVM